MSRTVIRQCRGSNSRTDGWLLNSAALSSCGSAREHNQDHVLADERAGIFIAADGVGGHEGGAEASQLLAFHTRIEVAGFPCARPLYLKQLTN